MSGELTKLLADLKEPEALEFVQKALADDVDPMNLLDQARAGMNIVGQRFADADYFIPDLVFSGEILKGLVKILEPHLKQEKDEKRLGKIVVGTVAGDIHDIGKLISRICFEFRYSNFGLFRNCGFHPGPGKPFQVHH